MPDGPSVSRALDHLYQGQSNDCYWHGLFGGIYIVHMRMATLGHLIAAEDLADAAGGGGRRRGAGTGGGRPYGARLADTDLDAIDEVLVTSAGQTVVVDLAEGAGISSWDLRASRVALGSVLRRRPEAYHQRLVAHEEEAAEAAISADADATARLRAAPKTIHDIVNVKEPGLAAFLHYDRHERRSGLVHLLPADGATSVEQLVAATYEELGDFVEGAYELDSLSGDRVSARRLGTVLVGGAAGAAGGREDVPLRRLTPQAHARAGDDGREPRRRPGRLRAGGRMERQPARRRPQPGGLLRDRRRGANAARRRGRAAFRRLPRLRQRLRGRPHRSRRRARRPPDWYPVETVSNSEGGFERVYQGSSLLFRWPVSLAPGDHATLTVSLAATQTIDHSARRPAEPGAPAGALPNLRPPVSARIPAVRSLCSEPASAVAAWPLAAPQISSRPPQWTLETVVEVPATPCPTSPTTVSGARRRPSRARPLA